MTLPLRIETRIQMVRGLKVIIDADLADLTRKRRAAPKFSCTPSGGLAKPGLGALTRKRRAAPKFSCTPSGGLAKPGLGALYGVSTRRPNEQVQRNRARFPADCMFVLDATEKAEVVAHCDHLRRRA